jgi:hypothetical protein
MAASDQTIADAARDSLLSILEGKSAEWAEASERARMLEIDRLQGVIDYFEKRANASGSPIFKPIKPVDV